MNVPILRARVPTRSRKVRSGISVVVLRRHDTGPHEPLRSLLSEASVEGASNRGYGAHPIHAAPVDFKNIQWRQSCIHENGGDPAYEFKPSSVVGDECGSSDPVEFAIARRP